MVLTKLEINGFKSFAKKTEIHFGRGITAIVGPNGSGKSNIADAVRWVLGEQSARLLRGQKMEDVIFGGSESRRPQGYCEVALTLDNQDHGIALDFSEVTIARRVYRSGESEYTINRNLCRLKDIHELFRDTGVGKEGYSIIGQGRVDEILSGKSGDRRLVFEEAAGVMRYRARKEEAERKLSQTRENMTRIEDILAELDAQLEPLAAQSAQAKEYLAFRDELKHLEVNVFLLQYDRIGERIRGAKLTLEQITGESGEETARRDALTARAEHIQARFDALETRIGERRHSLMAFNTHAEAILGETKVLQERQEHLCRERERLERENDQDGVRAGEIRRLLTQGVDEDETRRLALLTLEEALARTQEDLLRIDGETLARETQIEERKARMMEAMNRLSDAKSRETQLSTMRSSVEQREQDAQKEREQVVSEGGSLDAELKEASEELAALAERKEENALAKQALERELEAKRAQANEWIAQANDLEKRLGAARSRETVLAEMKKGFEGYFSSVRRLLLDGEKDPLLKNSMIGVVASLIRVPKELETAIETALGSALQNIVTPDEEDAKRIIEYLRRNNYGRATFLPLSALRPSGVSAEERRIMSAEGCVGLASELIEYEPRLRAAVEFLLGRTVIVRDLDVGVRLMKKRTSVRIATLAGDLIHTGGSMFGGSLPKKEFSLLGRERELAELSRAIARMQETFLAARKTHEGLLGELGECKDRRKECDLAGHELDVAISRQTEKLGIIRKYVEKNHGHAAELGQELEKLAETRHDILNQLEAARAARDGLEQGSSVSQKDIIREQAELNALRARRNAAQDSLTAQKVELMAQRKEEHASEQGKKQMLSEQKRLEELIAERLRAIEAGASSIEELRESVKTMEAKAGTERGEAGAIQSELLKLEAERGELGAENRRLQAEREERLGQERALSDRRLRAELTAGKAEAELTAMQERIWEDYGLTYEGAAAYKKDIAVTASNLRIDELKKAIRALGDVHVGAIEDYKMVKERHETLDAQHGDLAKAQLDLETLIRELLTTMEQQFKQQFALINANFGTVFQQLFGGGFAQLRFSDPSNVLGCEIEIVAQPPGKTLQLLSLLSGGERAMTAIALLFAMLRLKPTPFCILDEIESSLDEANVIHFANYVKQYSDKTQFILITHRKDSMVAAETLFGVAMEEKGVSKLVSVRLDEEEESA